MVKGYQFTDAFENGESDGAGTSSMSSGRSGAGCHVTVAVGFVLAFLAIAIAVGVGIIVHFAEKDMYDRAITCTFAEGGLIANYLKQIQEGMQPTTKASTTILTNQTTTTGATTAPSHGLGYRLPKDVRPVHYDLELRPDIYGGNPTTFGFQGHVEILLAVEATTNRIVINAFNLSISKANVSVASVVQASHIQVVDVAQYDDVEMMVIMLDQELTRGHNYTLSIGFAGPLTNDLDGLYYSSYKRGNETVYLATTQFESPDAREAFPCFDEPAIKATFKVTLLRKPPFLSLSNTKVERTEARADGWVADVYENTKPMSTYLLAFIICDFGYVNGTTPKGTEYKIWARKELTAMTQYALNTGMTILDFYGDVFGVDFPLKKQDMIAIPDFASGAMENWGLVTYREKNLVYSPGDTEAQRQRVTLVIAHELAHQWFGNLVTLAWWDDLWLNEGFAEFIEYIGMERIEPRWKVWEQFAISVIQYVFEFDQIMSSHPLYSPSNTVEEMEQYFDSISYEKGASVIHMIEFCLGESTFRKGLQRYLRAHEYGNANHTDLWNALAAQASADGESLNVAEIMNTWTLQMGFPVVKVTRNGNGEVLVTQRRFLINPDAKDPGVFTSPYGYQWEIPLTMTSSAHLNFNVTSDDVKWLHKDEKSKTFSPWVAMADGWFLVNVLQKGYYRVNYDASNWQALIKQLNNNHSVIPPINRAQIIDDSWNLANAEELDFEIALGSLEYLEQEQDYVPWAAASKQLLALKTRMTNVPEYGGLEKFIQGKVLGLFNRLGFNDNNASALESYTRTVAVTLACQTGIPGCVEGAVKLFKQWRQRPDHNPISPAVRGQVYCTAVAEGDHEDWLFVRTRLREEQSPNEQIVLREALACSSRLWVLSTVLQMSIEREDIRVGDATTTMAEVASNDIGNALTWNFVRDNWDVIFRDFAQSNSRMKSLFDALAAPHFDQVFHQELLTFLNSHSDLGRVEVLVKQAIEQVEFNMKWYRRSYPQLVQWLTTKGYITTDKPTTPEEEKEYRLPTAIKPIYYDLELQPDIYGNDPSTFSFQGRVSIFVECLNETNVIILNAKNLSISRSNVSVVASPGGALRVTDVTLNDKDEKLSISLDQQLQPASHYVVAISFSGPLTDDLEGLYLSTYKEGNRTVYLATTQFEAPYARQAFPCFDEPAIKAQFNVTLLRKPPLISLSNTKIRHTENRENGWVADIYETTPRMSTYLLAFIICDFVRINGTTVKGVEFGVWARSELSEQTRYALQTGMTTIDYYGDLFNTNFPLKKQDMIAIPDFAAGAMENWGLVTYRESYLLYKPGTTSENERQSITTAITHELAHQWFGNLVTLAWWDDLWLNEGFASYVQYIGLDKIDPSWKAWEQFAVDMVQLAMSRDQIASSHPLYSKAKTVEEMQQYFDKISYNKGASVIRMIEFCLGKETFRHGLQRYLANHSYANAEHSDLWNALAELAAAEQKSLDVANIMNTWTLQMGFPVVTASRLPNDSISVAQKRFLINPDAADPGVFTSPYGYQWEVPLTLASSRSPQFNENALQQNIRWLHKEQQTGVFSPWVPMPPLNETDGWFLINANQYGYYRVNYDTSNWQALIQQLRKNHTAIPTVSRAQIIDDSWNLANAGETSIEITLSLLEYLDKEEDYVPWNAANTLLADLRVKMTLTSTYGAIQRFALDKVKALFTRLSFDDTNATALESYTRVIAVRLACDTGLPECVTGAVNLFKQWKNNPDHNPISPTLRRQVYCYGVRHGDESDWLFVRTRFVQEQSPTEKDVLRKALSCTRQVWILSKLLDMALSGEIKRDDATGTIGDVAGNSAGNALAWDFLRSNWDRIIQDFGQSNSRLHYMIESIFSMQSSQTFYDEFKTFIDSHSNLGRAELVMTQALESIEFNLKWHKSFYDKIVQWLAARGYTAFGGPDTNTNKPTRNVRLPSNLLPLHYDLILEPHMYDSDPSTFTFNGSVALTFHCVETTNQIIVHINDLTVSNIHLTSGATPVVQSSDEDKELQFLIVTLDRNLTSGQNYTVSIDFEGPLDSKTLDGLYLSTYQRNSTPVYLATTQFEPTDARKAFPCMDEPGLKATFSITLIRRSFNKALSNMPVELSTDLGQHRVADKFMTSLPMSTYLVAMIVCDFEHKSKMTKHNTTYEVWSRAEAVEQVQFALDYGVEVIDFYEDYFEVPFPLPKQAMIAIPDFAAGAMENWGLITYRETRVLFEPGVSSYGDMLNSAMTISHELGHMWFGDLVSPQWWDELWLNEGFAKFMQYLATTNLRPDWKQWDQFVVDNVHTAMGMDGLVSSHPIYVPVATPEQINEIFDAISYNKGASIIRMIREALGEETFKKGITNYLNTWKYKNAVHSDLWDALNKQAVIDGRMFTVGDVMDTWTLQMNYPVVKVTRKDQILTLTQERFLKDPTAQELGKYTSPFGYKWDIPFTYTTGRQPNFNTNYTNVVWFNKNETQKIISVDPVLLLEDWVLGNIREVGYYRVNYDDDNWKRLATQLRHNHTVIDLVNRAQIIDDAWELASGGYVNQSIALSVLEYLDQEMDILPWTSASQQLEFMGSMLSSTELYGAFKEFMVNKTSKQYAILGMNNTGASFLESAIRAHIAFSSCKYDAPGCVKDAQDLFRQWRQDPAHNLIEPELRSTVYCTALRNGAVEDWEFLFGRLAVETNANEISRIQVRLACSEELWVLRRLLNEALYTGKIRSQDSLGVITQVMLNPSGTALAWNFIRESWNDIFDRYRKDPFALKNMVDPIGSIFNNRIQLQEMQAFVDSQPGLGTATRSFQGAMEMIRSNIKWMEQNFKLIKSWLQQQGFGI